MSEETWPGRFPVPRWLEPLLPDVVAPLLLDVVDGADGEEFWGVAPDGARRLLGAELEASYDAVEDVDVMLSDEVARRYGGLGVGRRSPMAFVPSQGGGTRLLFGITDADRVAVLADAWRQFAERDARWRAEPSFLNAFAWVDSHPAFWVRDTASDPGREDWTDAQFWRWRTGGHMRHVEVQPRLSADGTVVVELETGGHVPDQHRYDNDGAYTVEGAYRQHYYDPRLDVSAPTFEEAVRRLALAVDAVFDDEGCERADAPAPVDILPAGVAAETDALIGERPPQPRVRFADLGSYRRRGGPPPSA
ncbi:hypothetical protein [Xylanimonas ulmi]|uniref:Uncharacterized protein n=1 Tax=Xylanimonas ulmi TaxID=228973 RepID=A0A4Q7M2X5_9MICO|nr:hypothetical protein [Xylanibacterium ulmi]RZS62255.1 hypothetical protein EV386_2580 [Xylanibacterium ulmi]